MNGYPRPRREHEPAKKSKKDVILEHGKGTEVDT
jgi:hypothetical protein